MFKQGLLYALVTINFHQILQQASTNSKILNVWISLICFQFLSNLCWLVVYRRETKMLLSVWAWTTLCCGYVQFPPNASTSQHKFKDSLCMNSLICSQFLPNLCWLIVHRRGTKKLLAIWAWPTLFCGYVQFPLNVSTNQHKFKDS